MIVIDFEGFPHLYEKQDFVIKELAWIEFAFGQTLSRYYCYEPPHSFELFNLFRFIKLSLRFRFRLLALQ